MLLLSQEVGFQSEGLEVLWRVDGQSQALRNYKQPNWLPAEAQMLEVDVQREELNWLEGEKKAEH